MAANYQSLDPLKQDANAAATNYASMVQTAPSLLQDLQKNLTTVFAKDNPFIADRNAALENFLTTPSRTRAELLTPNMPNVEGSPLTLSPTQQDAIVQGRNAAAFAPLAGLNNTVTGIYGNIPQLVKNAGSIYESLLGGEKTKADMARQAYEDAFRELTQKETFRLQEMSQLLSAGGGGTNAGRGQAVLESVAEAARSGKTLDDIMRSFGTSAYVAPEDILRIYNTNSIYGPARENASALQSKYGVKSSMTAEQQNKQAAFGITSSVLTNIQNSDLSGVGTAGADRVRTFSAIPFGVGKKFIGKESQSLYSLNQQLELLKQNILKAFQGGRISDQDYKIAASYVPSIQDSPETIKTQLGNLENFINGATGGGGGDITRPPLSSFEY